MTRRRVGIVGLLILMLALSVWVVLPKHRSVVRPASGLPVSMRPPVSPQVPPAVAPAKPVTGLSLWARPAPQVAARNERRNGFAWILRQLGASEDQLDRLADLRFAEVLAELKQKAQAGDSGSINILGEIAQWNCRRGRDEATIESYTSLQIRDVQAVPAIDAAWFTAVMREDETFYKAMHAACAQVDVDQAMSWVESQANQGDAASLWLLSRDSSTMNEMQRRLREAAAAGFPQAQFELAWAIIGGQQGAAGSGTARVTAGEELRESEAQLPRSEMQLAFCEYTGCDGVEVDVNAAVKHAQEAARRGAIDAILALGAHLPAGQLDPNEVVAWGLIQASLQQAGCGGNGFSVREMKRISSTLNANNISAEARSLAEQYWRDYGSQMISNIGCRT